MNTDRKSPVPGEMTEPYVVGNNSVKVQYSGDESKSLDENLSPEAIKLARVADRYYQRIATPDGSKVWKLRDKSELKQDGISLPKVAKYHGFTVNHNFFHYKEEVNGWLNLSSPLPTEPKEGAHETTTALLQHIFGEQAELFLDYLSLLLTRPKQLLPVLVVTSVLQGTGKTTLLHLMRYLFGENATIINVSQYAQQFNALYASKLIICIDETMMSEEFIKERIKNDSTATTIQLRKMHSEHETLPFFGKFILATNKETNFAKLEKEDIRFWVVRVKKLEKYDPDFETKIKKEVPAFLYFLKHRTLSVPRPLSRMWFSPEQIRTDALEAVIRESRSKCAKDIEVLAADKASELGTFYATSTDIFEMMGKKYPLSEIRKALKEELKVQPEVKWYKPGGYGSERTGRCYTFTASEVSHNGKEQENQGFNELKAMPF